MKTNRHAAFTLMELMVSIALALILILGINEVFGLTAKTVGAGQALSSAYESNRSAQIVMSRDFNNMVPTAPLIITSIYGSVFRSPADQATNLDAIPSHYNPAGQSIQYPLNALSPRVQRLDTISFCVRDLFQRQTGGVSGAFISPSSSYEAYVWYGHLNVGDNTMPNATAWSNSTNPGQGTPQSNSPPMPPPANPNNYYSSQWVLGRMAMLFQSSTSQAYVPQIEYSATANSVGITGYTPQQSRFDVVSGPNEGSIDAFTNSIYFNDMTPSWWGSATVNGIGSNNMTSPGGLNYRFQCEPKPLRPLSTDMAAFFTPAFISSCSQFCVEFAGDYVSQIQSNPPQPTDGGPNTSVAPGPDGTIDFRMVNGVRQIMWYGMPRNVVGDVMANFNPAWNSQRPDVNTVQNIWQSAGALPTGASGQPQAYTFEKTTSAGMPTSLTPTNYIAAWHPIESNNPRPKLIRITWAVDDANNRLGLPVTFEYVFAVP